MNYENFESGNYEFEVRKLLKEIFKIYEKKVKQKILLENYVKLIELLLFWNNQKNPNDLIKLL